MVIDVYDILQSEDKATVPIYYEARLAKIDPNFEEVTEDAEKSFQCRNRSRRSQPRANWMSLNQHDAR